MPPFHYRVVLEVTDATTTLAYDIDQDDPGTWGPGDSLKFGWAIPAGAEVHPAQPAPAEASFSLVLADIADLGTLGIGAEVLVELYVGTGLDLVGRFVGRVSDMKAKATSVVVSGLRVPAVTVDVDCVDYTADLAEDNDVLEGLASVSDIETRLIYLIEQAGLTADVPAALTTIPADAAASTAKSTLQALRDYLDMWPIAVDATGGAPFRPFHRGVLRMDDPDTVQVVPLTKRYAEAGNYPGVLNGDGSLTWDADLDGGGRSWVASGVVDTDLAVTYTKSKRLATNKWTVKSATTPAAVASYATGDRPVVAYVREVELETVIDCGWLIETMTNAAITGAPGLGQNTGWAADGFTVWLHDDSQLCDLGAVLLTDPEALVRPLVVADVPPTQNPVTGGAEWFAGMPTSAVFTVSGGRPRVDVTLWPEWPPARPAGTPDYLTWDGVTAAYPTLTWDEVDPSLSWYAAHLVRQP